MKFCTQCGELLEQTDKFCGECGFKIEKETQIGQVRTKSENRLQVKKIYRYQDLRSLQGIEETSGVYEFFWSTTGRHRKDIITYIGQSKDIISRIKIHFSECYIDND